jgi:hypothetical protein
MNIYTLTLVDTNLDKLQLSAEKLLKMPKVYEKMKNTFYGNWQFLLYESMVRACTIKYLIDNEKDGSVWKKELEKQEKVGFFWIKGLVEELNKYESNRKKYKSLKAYMPIIVDWFNNLAK